MIHFCRVGRSDAIARRFVEEGANVFLCARGENTLNATAEELRHIGGRVGIHVADVSDQASVEQAVNHALAEFGNIDILVNNAGVMVSKRFMDYTFEAFDRIMQVNFYGVYNVTKALLPSMMAQKRGKIINMASTAGKWGSMNQSAYNTSKHAVVGLTKCLALEMAPFDIKVNAICPAGVEGDEIDAMVEHWANELKISKEEARKNITSRSPIGRFIKPEEVAALAVYLASYESDAMTAQSLSVWRLFNGIIAHVAFDVQ